VIVLLTNDPQMRGLYYFASRTTVQQTDRWRSQSDDGSGGFKVGGPEARLKRAPLMTSSFSVNRDKHFDQA